MKTLAYWMACVLVLASCSSEEPAVALTRQQLLDPQTCKTCHPIHYEQWSSSMHAYAAEDPVFLAMNRRGQEEAKLGDFCVNCHAPMAVREGLTTNGLNLAELPAHMRGVTCYFCHNAMDVEGEHGNRLKLANDTVMRGGVRDPVDPGAHQAAYSEFHDRNSPKSSRMCGACHDFEVPSGVFLERTFAEYRETLFARTESRSFDTCQGCHMEGRFGVIANVPGVPARRVHDHLWPGVDIALTDFPHRAAMRAAVEECALRNSIQFFSFEPDGASLSTFVATLETSAGHSLPSGAAQDRRMWLEIVGYDEQDRVVFESGRIADNESEERLKTESQAWSLHEQIFDANGEQVHMFWEVAKSARYPLGYVENALPGAKTPEAGGHSKSFTYRLPLKLPHRAEFRVRMRAVGFDVLQDLVSSGHLAPGVVAEMPTFTLYSAVVEWNASSSNPRDFTLTPTSSPDCERYRCMFETGREDACPQR